MAYSELTRKVLRNLPPEKWDQHPIVIGVSGGPDSVALLRITAEIAEHSAKVRIIIAHANHKQRGEDSEKDQQFVQALSARFNFSFNCQALPIESETATEGLESALRDLRYQWFGELAGQTLSLIHI